MLPLERFHGETHSERMEAARRRIPLLTGDWTNFQEYDPGMTLLELFSWLTGVQRRYMEGVSVDRERRLLALLEVPPLHARGARALLALERAACAVQIPQGVKWRAGELVFENEDPLLLTDARLVELRRGDGARTAVDALGEDRVFPLFGDAPRPGDWFELVFDPPLRAGEAGLYFDLAPPKGMYRNPVPEGAAFSPLARIGWKAWAEGGWRDAPTERDDTHGFLFPGLVRLRPGAGTSVLRATLESGGFDLPPRARGAAFPVLEVQQRDTLCRGELVTAGALRAGRGELHSYLSLYGGTDCYRRVGQFWRPCAAKVVPDPERGVARVDAPWTAALGEDEPELLAVSFEARLPPPADGLGSSGQVLELPGPGVEYERFVLLAGEGEDYSLWEKKEDLYGCGPRDRACRLEAAESRVCFGDGMHGMAPPGGTGNLRIAGLALTRGAASNLRSGQIGPPREGPYAGLWARQVTGAQGGRDEESHEHRKYRAAALAAECRRAVTAEDYERLVRAAPGLILEGVRVLPNCAVMDGRVQSRPGTVTVLVRGPGRAAGYLEHIRRLLESCRLAGTRVEVGWMEEL